MSDSTHRFNSSALEGYKPEDWAYLGFWKENLFTAYLWESWYRRSTCESLGLDMSEPGVFNFNGGHVFTSIPVRKHIQAQMREMVAREDSFFEKYEQGSRAACEEAIRFAKGELEALEVTPENLDTFVSHIHAVMFYWCAAACHIAWALEELFLEQVVEDGISPEAVTELIKIDSPLHTQQTELKALKREVGDRTLDEVRQDTLLLQKLEAHRKEYAWIEMANWIGDELTLEGLMNLIRTTSLEEHAPELPEISEKLGFLVRSLTSIGYGKQAGAEYISMFQSFSYPFLDRLAAHFGITYRELMCLTHAEIREGLTGMLSLGELKDRIVNRQVSKWLAISGEGGRAVIVDDAEDIRFIEALVPMADLETKELRGQAASRGLVTGRVKVVMNLDEFSKMENGDILVTTMTTPDFVILMQKSSAIVTDIGGMLSHAAIVSREMKKPCVIGTKFATQVFKDGDMVEVDANTGIVRMLARA